MPISDMEARLRWLEHEIAKYERVIEQLKDVLLLANQRYALLRSHFDSAA